MEPVSPLRTNLSYLLGSRGSGDEKELFDQLVQYRPALVKLYDVPPRSDAERRELQGGKITVKGRQMAVNNDFATQVIYLAQALDCSERYVAGLMQHVISTNPNLSPTHILEEVILEHHRRRRELVECLRFLLEATEAAGSADAPPIYTRLGAFVQRQILPLIEKEGGLPTGDQSLARKILLEIENLEPTITKAQAAKQSAGSNTNIQGTNITLGQDVLAARLDSLKYERRSLATVLYLIARIGYLSPYEVERIVPWLQQNPHHSMTYYLLTSLFVSFDPVDAEAPESKARQSLATHPSTLTAMKSKLNPSAEWSEPGLKAAILLKWTLFLTEARHRDSKLEHKEGFKTDELETNVWNAVQGDAFTYLASSVAALQKRETPFPSGSFAGSVLRNPDPEQQQRVPGEDFRLAVLNAFETLVRSVITHASSELRKIKQRQEDFILANARSDRSRVFRASTARVEPDKMHAPRNDIAMLFSFIGILYSSLPPDRALQFWGCNLPDLQQMSYMEQVESTAGKLPAFLQWAVWSTQPRDVDVSIALYDMIAGLAKGQQCSGLAYNFLARGNGEVIQGNMLSPSGSVPYGSGVVASWSTIFGLLESWTTTPSSARQAQPSFISLGSQTDVMASHQHQHQQQLKLTEKDVYLAQCFLRLLSTVASYSVGARTALSGHVHLRAIQTLIGLLPIGGPIELKGSVFAALAAFCEPGAGSSGVEICRTVWLSLERLEVINVRGGGSLAKRGVESELEMVEEPSHLYPETIPFLKLICTLIHTPKRVPLRSRVTDTEPIATIPESLGQPYRQPGIAPFVSFVVDQVFQNISSREYQVPKERWQMNDLCLAFIERCLASYDLESLTTSGEEKQVKGDVFLSLLTHPGFDIMQRLLSNSPLQSSLLAYLVDGIEGFDKSMDEEEPIFKTTIIRVLRIIYRVLEIQDIFLDVVIPLLSEVNNPPIVGPIHPRSYFIRFDHAMSFAPNYAPAVAAYITYPSHPELALLSVKILTLLTKSTAFPNLTTLLERSSDSARIIDGYRKVLDAENLDDVVDAEANAEQYTGAGAPDLEDIPAGLPQAVRIAALELLFQNTQTGSAYPNVGHLLLLGSTNVQQIQDPHALGSQRASIHAILDWVNMGVPRLKTKGKERRHQVTHTEPLFIVIPELAERFYRIVYQLCMHPQTSEFTLRYLRTREDFFARQLAALPAKVPAARSIPTVEVQYRDGARVLSTVTSLTAFLRLRSYIFDLVALDLHILTNRGHFKSVGELLDLIYGNEEEQYEEEDWEDEMFKPFHEVGQAHMRIIEIVQSLSFEWVDVLSPEPADLQFLGTLNLGSCIRTDDKGCEIVDRTALLSLLIGARRLLHAQGQIISQANIERLNAEVAYILESCTVENHRREVIFAVATGFEAWRRLVDMTLVKCFARLPRDRRETMLFDLLHELPPIIRSGATQQPTTVLLSEVSLSLITKLREDRRSQLLVQSAGVDSDAGSLPAERLYALLQNIIECILDSRIELVRGNLYAALINFFHLISSDVVSDAVGEKSRTPGMSLSASTTREDLILGESRSVALPSQSARAVSVASTLEAGSLMVLKPIIERLVSVISRDATDGTEVWKTVAFMLLDCLVYLSREDKQHSVLSALARHGFLLNFVLGLKESDMRLQSVLKPDPGMSFLMGVLFQLPATYEIHISDDLNPLYVYEAKMTCLIRVAQTRQGAERLLEARLLSNLASCDYLDARPEGDQSFMDQDSFLPSAIQRYHQLFMPALQLVDGILATLGPSHTTAANQALQFLSGHRDTVAILLKNDSDDISLSVLNEIHLLVSLCASVFPQVPKSELVSGNIGFGTIHVAVLSLAARCLRSGSWSQNVRPQTDAEMVDASMLVSGYGNNTKFNLKVNRKEQLLRKALIVYIGAASEFTESEITLVLSPMLMTPRHEEQRPTRMIATIPTVGDAIEALNDLCGDLAAILKQITDITAELSSKDHIRVENIQEIIHLPDGDILSDLDITQRRFLICRELERIRRVAHEEARTLLTSIEMLLLLLWRHLTYFCEGRHVNNPSLKASTSGVMRYISSSQDSGGFQSEAAKKIAPALQRLAAMDFDYESTECDWRSNQAYIEVMSRRLRDTVGLHVEDEMDFVYGEKAL
ncbi:hypothetical protein EW146_g2707 [Bondarzewia mesenterica]|uniref:Nucleoporin Nup186/Nup192/Nup205 n=1 Tax=Bondarzewia mesenterica TaxID=1095465 RepID=A0A4S4M029_9AGAM|nr:hypothetical protein EW146_g2707 [Bondarzewia mesenterica]